MLKKLCAIISVPFVFGAALIVARLLIWFIEAVL